MGLLLGLSFLVLVFLIAGTWLFLKKESFSVRIRKVSSRNFRTNLPLVE